MRRFGWIAMVLFISSIKLDAQDFNASEEQQYQEATSYFFIGDYNSSLKLYLDLYFSHKKHPQLNYRIGVCIFEMDRNKEDAASYFTTAAKGGVAEAYFYLGRCYHSMSRFNKAIKAYNKYRSSGLEQPADDETVMYYLSKTAFAKDQIKHPQQVMIRNMGKAINSEEADYVPVLSSDENELYFTSRRNGSTGGGLDPYDRPFEDIYRSSKVNGVWQPAVNIGPPINTGTHDAAVSMSSDGKHLIIFRTSANLVSGDLYYSTWLDSIWSLPIKFPEGINSDYNEPSASWDAANNVVYFSSDRPGGYGGLDLYRITQFADGTWSKATNLGPVINTRYDEDAPFIHPNGISLYFSSKGHRNMGAYDIFRSDRDQEGFWEEPANLGYPINTVNDDIYFVLSADWKTGYYSSDAPGGYGKQDIYALRMPSNMLNYVIVRAVIQSADSVPKPLRAKITAVDEDNHIFQGVYNSSRRNGRFIMSLRPGTNYQLIVETENNEGKYVKELFVPSDASGKEIPFIITAK